VMLVLNLRPLIHRMVAVAKKCYAEGGWRFQPILV
jgi:hypothetical protein